MITRLSGCLRLTVTLAVLPLLFFCVFYVSTVSAASVELLHEDFESWPPPGWTIVNNTTECVWESNTHSSFPNYAGGDGKCADANALLCMNSTPMDTELQSPVLDLSNVEVASLSYIASYNDFGGADFAKVLVSPNGGGSWQQVSYWTTDHDETGPGEKVTIDLTPFVGSANVIVSFRYYAPSWDQWYQVDQVVVIAYQETEYGGEWQTAPPSDFQFTRFDGEYYPGDKKVYFMGGRLPAPTMPDTDGSVWSFDPATGVYADTGVDLPIPISNYKMNLLQDGDGNWGFYVFCGRPAGGGVTDAVQVYYPDTNSVVQLPPADNYPGTVSCTLALNVVYNNRMYMAGGLDPLTPPYNYGHSGYFDPTAPVGDKWRYLGPLPNPRAYIMGAVVDDLIYAIGGNTYDGVPPLKDTNIVEVMDPNAASPVWEDASAADLPIPCSSSQAFGFNSKSRYQGMRGRGLAGKIITGCGQWPDEIDKVFIYDTKSDKWDLFPSLQLDRRDQAAAFLPPGSLPGNGMSGMCMWGGRKDSESNVLTTPEFYPVKFPFPWHMILPAVLGDRP